MLRPAYTACVNPGRFKTKSATESMAVGGSACLTGGSTPPAKWPLTMASELRFGLLLRVTCNCLPRRLCREPGYTWLPLGTLDKKMASGMCVFIPGSGLQGSVLGCCANEGSDQEAGWPPRLLATHRQLMASQPFLVQRLKIVSASKLPQVRVPVRLKVE
jgi:hypothetical protein